MSKLGGCLRKIFFAGDPQALITPGHRVAPGPPGAPLFKRGWLTKTTLAEAPAPPQPPPVHDQMGDPVPVPND